MPASLRAARRAPPRLVAELQPDADGAPRAVLFAVPTLLGARRDAERFEVRVAACTITAPPASGRQPGLRQTRQRDFAYRL